MFWNAKRLNFNLAANTRFSFIKTDHCLLIKTLCILTKIEILQYYHGMNETASKACDILNLGR